MGAAKQTIFVGFDSAWADKPDGPGAICSIAFSGDRFSDFAPPEMVGFGAALTHINRLRAIRRNNAHCAGSAHDRAKQNWDATGREDRSQPDIVAGRRGTASQSREDHVLWR